MSFVDYGEHVFVVGSSRSGTTLVGGILASSGLYAEYRAEQKLLAGCSEKYGRWRNAAARKRFLKDWFASRQFIRSGLTKREFISACCSPGVKDYVEVLGRFMESVAAKQGRDRWMDTSPQNCMKLEQVAQAFPKARVVHVVRDGRAVALSMARLGWASAGAGQSNKALRYGALKWEHSVTAAAEAAPLLGDRYMEVKYEELIGDPESTIERLRSFVGAPSMRLPPAGGWERKTEEADSPLKTANSAFGDMGPGLTDRAVFRWKEIMANEQVRIVEEYVGDTLVRFGYPILYAESRRIGSLPGLVWERLILQSRRALKDHTLLGRLGASPLEVGVE